MNPSESESSRPEASGLQVELGAKKTRHLRLIWLLVLLVFIAVVTGATLIGASPSFFSPALSPSPIATLQSSSSTQPKIAWSQNNLEVILSPGETATRNLTFTSSLNIQNLVIEPVPAIAPFVSIQPNSFANVSSGQPQSVRLLFSIPPGATLGTYEGTIHVRLGSQTLPQTLKVALTVWNTYSDASMTGVTLKIPPQWNVTNNAGNRAQEGNLCGEPAEGPHSFAPLGVSVVDPLSIRDRVLVITAPADLVLTIAILSIPPSGEISICRTDGTSFNANGDRDSVQPPPYYVFFDAANEIEPAEPVYVLRKYVLYGPATRLDAFALSSIDTNSLASVGCNWSPSLSRESCAQQYFESNGTTAPLRALFSQVDTSLRTLTAP